MHTSTYIRNELAWRKEQFDKLYLVGNVNPRIRKRYLAAWEVFLAKCAPLVADLRVAEKREDSEQLARLGIEEE
jgi:hypothetical protein